jgi:DNA mismatch endonuclease (patch repair protein)
MRSVRSRHTKPEILVRSALHRLGFRFRLHRKDLPGKPDIVLPKLKTAIFVNGCFWHRHSGCAKATSPKSNVDFWNAKFEANVARDLSNRIELESMGWRVVVVWQCQSRSLEAAMESLRMELSGG